MRLSVPVVLSWFGGSRRPKRFGAALVLSVTICLFVGHLGTSDVEDSLDSAFSIAGGGSQDFFSLGTRNVGISTFLGVPVFDALQGAGGRLPYQASWTQSPEWPLRYVLSNRSFTIFRVFLSSLILFLAAFSTLNSWRSRYSRVNQLFFGFLLCAPVGVYLKLNDWSDKYSLTAGIVGAVFLLLHRRNFEVQSDLGDIPTMPILDRVVWFWSVVFIATGNPGYLPTALVAISPIIIMFFCSAPIRSNFIMWLRTNLRYLLQIGVPALLVILVVAIELVAEATGASDWDTARSLHTQGFITDRTFVGVSSGYIPESIERIAGVLTAFVTLPVVRLLYDTVLPVVQPTMTLTGSFPRGEFGGGLVLFILILSCRRFARGSAERSFVRTVVFTEIMILSLAFVAANDILPSLVAPSAAWGFFPILLAINVLAAFVLQDNLRGQVGFVRATLWLNSAVTVIWVLMQLSLLTIYPVPSFTIPPAEATQNVSSPELEAISYLLTDSRSRMALAAYQGEYSDKASLANAVLDLSKPVLAPAYQKTRNANNLVIHAPTQSKIPPINFAEFSLAEFDELMDFLEIQHVLVEDPASDEVQALGGEILEFNRATKRGDVVTTATIQNREYLVWVRTHFTSAILNQNSAVNSDFCPLLEERCDVITKTLSTDSRSTPRLTLCRESCLWQYQLDEVTEGQSVIIPVSFDGSLRVEGANKQRLTTRNVGGFLAVTPSSNEGFEIVRISSVPDARMFSRIFASYLYLFCFIWMIWCIAKPFLYMNFEGIIREKVGMKKY